MCITFKIFTFAKYNYRPQRSCGQGYVFTRVCDSVNRGGVSGQAPRAGRTPPTPGTRQTPLAGRTPPGPGRPPRQGEPPGTRQTPPREENCSIRSMSGRYASYWNAFLFLFVLYCLVHVTIYNSVKSFSDFPLSGVKTVMAVFIITLIHLHNNQHIHYCERSPCAFGPK